MGPVDRIERPAENSSSHSCFTSSVHKQVPQQLRFVLDLDPDAQAVYFKRQRCSGGKIHHIFFGGHQRLSPRVHGLTRDFFQIGGGVAMVIAKHQTWRSVNAKGFKRPPERPRLAQPAKGGNRAGRKLALRDYSSPENWRRCIVAADQSLDSHVAILSAGNDHRGSSIQRCKWLTKPAERKHTAAQRIQRVDQDDVRMQFLLHAATDSVAISADSHMRSALAHVLLRLISGLIYRGSPTARDDHVCLLYTSPSPRDRQKS